MEEEFSQKTSPFAALRGILSQYPLSVGLFREVLQNSDDAGATKQTFVLDRRSHPTDTLYHSNLANTQGPALLAFNNANFQAPDWEALQSAYESSKANDSSKIGKYGVGFRSVFHITDCPQILSGSYLAMFDPLRAFTGSTGKKLDLGHVLSQHPDQLAPFARFLELPFAGPSFEGTVIRCPLRNLGNKISSKVVSADEIFHLFTSFIREEIDISLLFLQHIQEIEIHDVDERGTSTCLVTLSISRSEKTHLSNGNITYVATTTTITNHKVVETAWRVLQYPSQQAEAVQLLKNAIRGDPTRILKEHKLIPTVGLAISLKHPAAQKSGRLFTYLPLPIPTGFPIHIHALFALTQSRQNLRNLREIGLIPGSDDHIFIEWNRLLFNHYIPRAWAIFLKTLADKDEVADIFSSWPPDQRSPATSGETVYWESLPTQVFTFTASLGLPIWPVYQSSPPRYRSLGDLIISAPSIPNTVLRTLANIGLQFTCPPQYIVDVVKSARDARFKILTPEEAHGALLDHLDALQKSSKEDKSVILEYLLSTKNVMNLIQLPIVPLPNGSFVALRPATNPVHTLLNRAEYETFGPCDDSSIALHLLPPHISDILQNHGPGSVNVEGLTLPRIIQYLSLYPNQFDINLSLVRIDPKGVKWLSRFWVWFNTYKQRDDLFSRIRTFFLLPSTQGLQTAEKALFKSRGEHPLIVQHLSRLDIPFLDPDFSEQAQTVLAAHGLLKYVSDVHSLLDSIPSTYSKTNSSQSLTKEACTAILKHISSHARIARSSFSEEQRLQLRSLPIYPIADFSNATSALNITWAGIPDDVSPRSISHPTFLPRIDGLIFVQLNSIAPDILKYVDPSNPGSLLDVQLLKLTVDNFVKQPDHIQAAALKYIVRNRQQIPPSNIEVLRGLEFVLLKDGSRKRPGEVIDPTSNLAPLYINNQAHEPKQSSDSEKTIVVSLQSLGLFNQVLTIAIVQERIAFISSSPSSDGLKSLAKVLLSLICSTHLDYSQLNIPPTQRWLPTNQGLRSPTECREATMIPLHLFDKVLAVLKPYNIPSGLRKALGWDQPLSADVLMKQLGRVLDTPSSDEESFFSTVLDIIKEIASRNVGNAELKTLQDVTLDRKWVPTINRNLAEATTVVFSPPVAESGFHQSYPFDQKVKELLRRVGCTDMPSAEAIVHKLEALQNQAPTLSTVNASLGLLRSLPNDFPNEIQSKLLIPDTTNILRPFSEIYFNDIGNRADLIPSESDFVSHGLIDEALTRKLKLKRLGLKYVNLQISGVDMGEKPVTTVRKNLRQYTEQQFITEFLANAADAEATEFTLLVNEVAPKPEESLQALSPAMAEFCTSPSLLIHNNSVFSEADFVGICRTSVGTKEGKRGKIGQFGLGALTMFHFTELAIVVSNNKVLFLNPSKEHLPIPDLAALLLDLNHIRRFYPSHLVAIDGLFGFDISTTESYNGTIFILPLRQRAHCEGKVDAVSQLLWTPGEITDRILKPFHESAPACLLFTGINTISAFLRGPIGDQIQLWSFEAYRTQCLVEETTGFSATDIIITDAEGSDFTWKVVTSSSDVPFPYDLEAPLVAQHRLRLPPVAGLAISLDHHVPQSRSHKFFSTLPLGITTSLPLHIMASFVLSSDRRQIRLDEYGNPETQYNKWLLSKVIPPLYLFLLENSLQREDPVDNKQWWPRHRANDDIFSRIIVDAFYSDTTNLKDCSRKIFRSLNHPSLSLSPQEAILSGDEPSSVAEALTFLRSRRIVKLGTGAHRLAVEKAQIQTVNPAFLKNEIAQYPEAITSELTFKHLEDIISFLSDPKAEEAAHLVGLPILQLQDGSFGTFQEKSNPECYFVWMPQHPETPHNFPERNFVHPKLKVRNLLKTGLNILPLDPTTIVRLVASRLPASSPFQPSVELSTWIHNFWVSWPEYVLLGLDHSQISVFPLVPTIRHTTFVSLSHCKESAAILVGGRSRQDESIRNCLDELGLDVVRPDEEPTPYALQIILQTTGYPTLTFENLISALVTFQHTITDKFQNLSTELHSEFASWARERIQHIPEHLIAIAQELPIWRSERHGSTIELLPASAVFMLPQGIRRDLAAPFMSEYVANYGPLRHLNGPILTFAQLADHLELSSTFTHPEMISYGQLLHAWIPRLPSEFTNPIRVPNSSLELKASDELYSRDALFLAAFGSDSDRFIPLELQELEGALHKHGLRNDEQLDIHMFRMCAEAVNNRLADDGDGASVVFDAYCVSLPMQVGANERESWHQLDDLCFIPRNMGTERRLEDQVQDERGLEIPLNIRALPSVVSPIELLRQEFESVAWTQRAQFAAQPHQRVLLAYPALGRPKFQEVIRHLRALSSFQVSTPEQRRILLHDLEDTYSFLEDNIGSATGEDVVQIRDGALFLNVESPNTDTWQWDEADQLVFETHDLENSVRHVRSFLLPYHKLLRAAGVLQVHHPQFIAHHATDSSDSSRLVETIRVGFNDLRMKEALTDVVFVPRQLGEMGDSEEDEPRSGDTKSLVAHRSFLAVFSEYFADAFCGDFVESRTASSKDPVKMDVEDYSRESVELVLDYIYTGIQSIHDAQLELLLEAIQLSGYWRINDLFEAMQREIIRRKLFTPRSLDSIRKAATVSQAKMLLQACAEYEDRNASLIRKVMQIHSVA